MITGTLKFMTISFCCQKWTTDLCHHLPTKSCCRANMWHQSSGAHPLTGFAVLWFFFNFVNFYFGVNTQKMAFLVKNECKNFLLIEKLVVPEACDISPQIIQVQAGFTWPYCRVLKIFNKSSINFAIFWSNFKIFPLAF